MNPEIHVTRDLKILTEDMNITIQTMCKEIKIPNATNYPLQFNLTKYPCDDYGGIVGYLVVDTERGLEELFDLLQTHSGFKPASDSLLPTIIEENET